MFENFLVILAGVFAGTITGVIPGVGVTTALIFAIPLLGDFSIIQLMLFYMALASTVQYTGTIPSVYLGYPGESNSLPAVIEGGKFTRHGQANLAIGISAIGSTIGSTITVLLSLCFISFFVKYLTNFFSNDLKFFFYILVIVFCLLAYNKKNILINFLLCLLGLAISLPGEGKITDGFRYTFGIEDLEYGIPFIPVMLGLIVVPSLTKMFNVDHDQLFLKNKNLKLKNVLERFYKKYTLSSVRGSIIGFFCGFVPGITTVLATNASYSMEKKLHPTHPGKMLVASESANNAGQFSSMLPLLLIGIPITGSEVILYSLLVDAGWSPFQFSTLSSNAEFIFSTIVPWFVVANLLGLLIAWPYAKKVLQIFSFKKSFMLMFLISLTLIVNGYTGYVDYRFYPYMIYLIILGAIGYLLRRYELMPAVFMFILGREIEGVFYRAFLLSI
jgi:putative tricarboxylic transport membrane protein